MTEETLYQIERTAEYSKWLAGLRDAKAKARIAARTDRLAEGLFGDSKFLRDGVYELRIDVGKGYRVYFTRRGNRIILLLSGGNKHRQSADIDAAVCLAELK